MALLVGVLLSVRRKDARADLHLWTAGLLLILLECAAHIVYELPGTSVALHRGAHVIALESYLLAGVLFLRSATPELRRMARSNTFVWINVAPHLAMLTVYGLDIRKSWVYYTCIVLGVAAAVISCALLARRWWYYIAFVVIWTPLVITSNVMQYRRAIYITLFFLYAMCGVAFRRTLPRGSRGKIVVVTGFALWSLCFLTHPVVAQRYTDWLPFANEVWDLQKFIITVGLLLVLLEDQIRSSEWMALHDELTSLPNRRLFDDRLQHALARAARDGHRVAIFNLDLDGFKAINDTLGHEAGDVLLIHVARHLQAATRRTDTLARLGGDEFSLIAVDVGCAPVGAQAVAHAREFPQMQRIQSSLLQAVELPVQLGAEYKGAVVQVFASVGIAVYPDDAADPAALMRIADQRMYAEKEERSRRGRGVHKALHLQAI